MNADTSQVIKTQPCDVEVNLPPLSHKVVKLQPSFYDRLTANLFTLVLTANAITSERTDTDYLFHQNSHKERVALVSNVRQSSLCWTGFDEADIRATASTSRGYLEKKGSNCTEEDRELLLRTLEMAEIPALGSEGWKAMSRCHELGVVIRDWPVDTAEHWSFEKSEDTSCMLTGISQLLTAQEFVNKRCMQSDPGEGLGGAGIKALAPARQRQPVSNAESVETEAEKGPDESAQVSGISKRKRKSKAKQSSHRSAADKVKNSRMTKSGLPVSSLGNEPVLKKRRLLSSSATSTAAKGSLQVTKIRQEKNCREKEAGVGYAPNSFGSQGAREPEPRLPSDSPFSRSRIIGTT
jgi:hypothetical protein